MEQYVGVGLVDFLTTDQNDPATGELLPNWGVLYKNDEERERYKKLVTPETIPDALYIMKANTPLNSEMYSYCQTQMQNGKLKFLVDENQAKVDRMDQTKWKNMTASQRETELRPYVMTTILREELANLMRVDDGTSGNVILKPSNQRIKHDKVSAFIYGLYYCKMIEDKRGKRKAMNIKDLMLWN